MLVPDDSLRSSSDVRLTSFGSPSSGHRRAPLALSVHQGQPAGKPVSWRIERARPAPGSTVTQAPQRSEERGSKDGSASRLSSLREIGDFPLAVRTRCVLTTSRESFALSNDSEPRDRSRPRAFEVLTSSQSSPPRTVPYASQCTRLVFIVILNKEIVLPTTGIDRYHRPSPRGNCPASSMVTVQPLENRESVTVSPLQLTDSLSDYKYVNLTATNFHTYLCGPVRAKASRS